MLKLVSAVVRKTLDNVFSERFSKIIATEGTWYPEGSFLADGHIYAWYKDPQRVLAIFLIYRGKEE